MKKLNQLLLFSCICVGFTLLKGIEAEAVQPQLIVDEASLQSVNVMPAGNSSGVTKKKKKSKKKSKNIYQSRNNTSQQKSVSNSKSSKPNLNDPNEALGYRIERLRLITKSLKKAYTTWVQSGAGSNTPQYEAVDQLIKGKLINRIKKLQKAYNEWLKFNGSNSSSQNVPSFNNQPVEDGDWRNSIPAETPMAYLKEDHKAFTLVDKSESNKPADTLYRLSKENLENLHKELEKYRTINGGKSDKA